MILLASGSAHAKRLLMPHEPDYSSMFLGHMTAAKAPSDVVPLETVDGELFVLEWGFPDVNSAEHLDRLVTTAASSKFDATVLDYTTSLWGTVASAWGMRFAETLSALGKEVFFLASRQGDEKGGSKNLNLTRLSWATKRLDYGHGVRCLVEVGPFEEAAGNFDWLAIFAAVKKCVESAQKRTTTKSA